MKKIISACFSTAIKIVECKEMLQVTMNNSRSLQAAFSHLYPTGWVLLGRCASTHSTPDRLLLSVCLLFLTPVFPTNATDFLRRFLMSNMFV